MRRLKLPGGRLLDAFKITPHAIFICSLALFFIVFSHYLQLNRSGVGLELPFNAMGWIPVSWAIGAGLYAIGTEKKFAYDALTVRLGILLCLLVLPFFLPMANQDDTFDRVLGLLGGFLLFIGLQQFRLQEEQSRLLLLLVIIAVWVELILGWDMFLRSIGIGVSPTRPVWEGPPHGIFQQRNVFASFIATGIVLSAYLLGHGGKIHGRRFQPYYLVLLLLPAAGIHLLIAMSSRTGWLGFVIGSLLVLPWLARHAPRIVGAAWLVSVAAGFIISWQFEENTAWDAPERELVSLTGLRQIHLPQTIEMIREKPVLGYGYGTFEPAYLNFTAAEYASGENDLPGVSLLDHPHNEILFWGAEGGLYAVVILLLAAWFVWQRVAALPWLHRLGVIGLFFPIVLHTQLEYPFYQSVLHWIIFVILIFWVDRLSAEYKTQTVESVLLIRLGAILVPLVSTAFLATSLHAGYLLARFDSDLEPNVESLAGIINPVVYRDRINWAIMSRLVLQGAINNRPEYVQPYIEWAPDLLARKPRPNFYRFLILAYQVAGDEENVQRVMAEASYLFPDDNFELPRVRNAELVPVPFESIER